MLRLPTFTYRQPKSLREALAMKADAGPEGSYVAGGTDLYPNMKRRQQEPRTVISLMGIDELRGTRNAGRGTEVGANVTLSDLSANPTIRLGGGSSRRARFHSFAPQHGHARRQPLPRHAVQLLRPVLRMAQSDRL